MFSESGQIDNEWLRHLLRHLARLCDMLWHKVNTATAFGMFHIGLACMCVWFVVVHTTPALTFKHEPVGSRQQA
eukprot:15484162-Alexandrium_andersonii.AAC.2